MSRFIGIDTSCYTTSIAVYDSEAGLVGENRQVLKVKGGHRGLSQSEMVYQHVRNLPVLLKSLEKDITDINGVGVSAFPRRRADSYMPAFLVGKGAGEMLGGTLHVPVYYFSHQENHAMAALRHIPELWGKPFYMIHLSGGTQDVLSVTWNDDVMDIREIMSSMDITAGQFIDRVGVAMGLPFPAGAKLEAMALAATDPVKIPPARVKGAFSFSGVETKVQKMISEGTFKHPDIAAGVLISIGKALEKELMAYPFEEGRPFIAVGGVMSDLYIREVLNRICDRKKLTLILAEPKYSSDNATGNAFGAYMRHRNEGLFRR